MMIIPDGHRIVLVLHCLAFVFLVCSVFCFAKVPLFASRCPSHDGESKAWVRVRHEGTLEPRLTFPNIEPRRVSHVRCP
jgi:hypothetical protein